MLQVSLTSICGTLNAKGVVIDLSRGGWGRRRWRNSKTIEHPKLFKRKNRGQSGVRGQRWRASRGCIHLGCVWYQVILWCSLIFLTSVCVGGWTSPAEMWEAVMGPASGRHCLLLTMWGLPKVWLFRQEQAVRIYKRRQSSQSRVHKEERTEGPWEAVAHGVISSQPLYQAIGGGNEQPPLGPGVSLSLQLHKKNSPVRGFWSLPG